MKRGFLKSAPGKKSPFAIDTPKVPAQTASLSDAVKSLKITSETRPEKVHIPYPVSATVPDEFGIEYHKKGDEEPDPQTLFKANEACFRPGTATDGPPEPFMFCTVPLPDIWGVDSLNGSTQCMFTQLSERQAVISALDWPRPVVPETTEERFRIGASPLGGLGMFALTDIKRYEMIYAERPLLMMPMKLPVKPPVDLVFDEKKMHKEALDATAKYLKIMCRRMTPAARATYDGLANVHPESEMPLGIFRTNGFGLSITEDSIYSAVYNNLSRVNHSCAPNSGVIFTTETFSGQIHAFRDIKAGEELVISYCDEESAVDERYASLIRYGFQCKCRYCSDPKAESMRSQIRDDGEEADQLVFSILNGVEEPSREEYEKMLKDGELGKTIVERLGLQSAAAYGTYMAMAVMAHRALGNHTEYSRLFSERKAWGTACRIGDFLTDRVTKWASTL